jgi:hypothetical protein
MRQRKSEQIRPVNLSRSSVLRERRLWASLIEEIGGDAAVLDVNLRGETSNPLGR